MLERQMFDPEDGGSSLQLWIYCSLVDEAITSAYSEGYDDGYSVGHKDGYDEGRFDGAKHEHPLLEPGGLE